MRTTIDIDGKLMKAALQATGLPTRKDTIEKDLRLLVKTNQQNGLGKLRGTLAWDGDLDAMRR